MTDERDRLLNAALAHVPFDGMNDKALMAAAEELGISRDMVRVHFPEGGASLAAAYHRRGDALLRDWMEKTPPEGRYAERVAQAIWHRLELVQPELVRAGATVLSLPQHAALGARLVWETADTIWNGLGDTSRDVNWYTKRATLSAVWGSTVLYWLGDESEGKAETRAFIDRRIENVMGFEKFKAQARKVPGLAALTDLATGWMRAPGPRDLPGKTKEH
ncbi:COQ9 family protein [Paracoccus zhejiangensis]|uniref:COQ9 family protein n=1 Tax=Paracoccus zhejiangensis TaxID=1077935 RepID=A0A2H5F269_9RHOB|nr:COQ9 family protein [Paracoccus zhejiangensis]AUH65623.1 COQ9 family protein [Paracoccus zhejiangensis]